MSWVYLKWFLAALAGGAGCGLAGAFLVAMNLSFMGVCLSHAALAGAVLAYWIGTPVLVTALLFSMAVAAMVGPIAERTRTHANTIMSILFSMSLGFAFLGIGLMRDHRTELLGLMWGNLLLVRWEDLWPLFAAWLVPLAFAVFFAKEVKAVLFDREIARACGIPAAAISNAIIAFSGIAVTVNLNIVGGLMLFSLLTHPAAAAMQLARRTRDVVVLSIVLGAVSAVGGLCLSYMWDWPAGASIVLVSSFLYAVALVWRGIASGFNP
ncbi:MAG: metal ABC transporter permease [Verrucomicrobiota bacterium]|nr:metal ABC transporter permease [Verrucomicrobiota bacterium]MDD8051087.1 metal ABC transporter permease [Verrucomicrobiota bacterium]MDI9384226.1 metal ABC transporter permease [Verrucomicrobiota bacterium]